MSDTDRRAETGAACREIPTAEEAARRRAAEADAVRMRCPVCEVPADWAGQKWRCRRCGWLSS